MRLCQLFIFPLLLSIAVVTHAQTAPPGASVKLSLAGNKTVYKIGEPIKLVMEFTADREGYVVEYLPDNKEPGLDTVVVAPETGVTGWLSEWRGRGYPRHVFSTDKLTNSPRRVEFFLNDTVRFDSRGRYTVTVNTNRIWKALPAGSETKTLPASTNSISFEVQTMTELEEEKEVKRIVDALAAKRDPRSDDELGRQLSYLTGDPSTREKMKRFLANENRGGNFGIHIWYGLFIARNRSFALKLAETAMRDPNTPVTWQLLSVATSLRLLLANDGREKTEAGTAGMLEGGDPRATEINDEYVMELAAGLGKRTSESQTTTATTILMALPKDAQAATVGVREVRRVLVQQFDSLNPIAQEGLLQRHWEQLRDPALVPALKKLASTSGMFAKNLHEAALKRLLELAPEEVRPYVIAEIRDPRSLVDPELLGQLKDESLPEIDAPLLEQVRALAESTQPAASVFLRVKAALLMRFATANIYSSVLEIYQTRRTKLTPDCRAGLLAYLAKHNEREGIALIEQVISELKPGDYPRILSDLTKLYYSESIGALLKKLLESDDSVHASHAAYLIGREGSAGDERVLEARLKRWREEWGNRIGQDEAEVQGQVERELIYALIHSKKWKLSDERVKELKQSCLTKMCKETHQRQ